MKLSEIFIHLAHGELSNLQVGTRNSGRIAECDYPALISHINLGLSALFSAFNLRQKEVIIEQKPGVALYLLNSRHALTNSESAADKFILDTEEHPFIDDIIKIEQVFRGDGSECGLNNAHDPESLYTPAFNILQVPKVYPGEPLAILYRADHIRLTVQDAMNADQVEVEIPDLMLEALLLFVWARVASAMGSDTAMQDAVLLRREYNFAIMRYKDYGIVHVDTPTNLKLRQNGWV